MLSRSLRMPVPGSDRCTPSSPKPVDHQHMIGNHQRNVARMGQSRSASPARRIAVFVLRGHVQPQAGHVLRVQNPRQLRQETVQLEAGRRDKVKLGGILGHGLVFRAKALRLLDRTRRGNKRAGLRGRDCARLWQDNPARTAHDPARRRDF